LKISNAALRFRPPDEPGKAATPAAAAAASPAGAGPGGPGGGSPGARRGRPQRASKERNVYVLANGKPVAVPVKLGISDGVTTEVLEGLKDGDVVLTGMTVSAAASKVATPAPNPLSGQGPRRF
jgi:HlyD family secretion protein